MQLNGRGRLRFSDFSLAIRLLPRGQLGALSDLVSAVTGTVYAIDIEGTPANPEATLTPMPILVSAPDLKAPEDDSREEIKEDSREESANDDTNPIQE